MEKRRYNRGFHISYAKKIPSTKNVNEREELSLDPTDATKANTNGEELIHSKHPKMVYAIRENTEPTQKVAQAEVLVEADANWNREVVSKQTGRMPFAKTHLIQKTKRSIAPKTIENMTSRRRDSNINALASAESSSSIDDLSGTGIWMWVIAGVIIMVLLAIILAGTTAGKVLLAILIIAGSIGAVALLVWLIVIIAFVVGIWIVGDI